MSTESYKLKKEGDYWTTEVLGQKYGFRKWTWGEKNALSAECSSVNSINGTVSFNTVQFNEQMMHRTVYRWDKNQLVQLTVEEIKALDGQLGERLFQITTKMNLVSNVETQNL